MSGGGQCRAAGRAPSLLHPPGLELGGARPLGAAGGAPGANKGRAREGRVFEVAGGPLGSAGGHRAFLIASQSTGIGHRPARVVPERLGQKCQPVRPVLPLERLASTKSPTFVLHTLPATVTHRSDRPRRTQATLAQCLTHSRFQASPAPLTMQLAVAQTRASVRAGRRSALSARAGELPRLCARCKQSEIAVESPKQRLVASRTAHCGVCSPAAAAACRPRAARMAACLPLPCTCPAAHLPAFHLLYQLQDLAPTLPGRAASC